MQLCLALQHRLPVSCGHTWGTHAINLTCLVSVFCLAAPVTLGLGIPLLSMGERRAIKNKSQKRRMEKKGRQEGRKREKTDGWVWNGGIFLYPRAGQAKAGAFLWVQGQPVLCVKFQTWQQRNLLKKKTLMWQGAVMHSFDPNTGSSLSSRPVWSTDLVLGWPGLYREALFKQTSEEKQKES